MIKTENLKCKFSDMTHETKASFVFIKIKTSESEYTSEH